MKGPLQEGSPQDNLREGIRLGEVFKTDIHQGGTLQGGCHQAEILRADNHLDDILQEGIHQEDIHQEDIHQEGILLQGIQTFPINRLQPESLILADKV